MSATSVRRKVDALLVFAGGQSQRAAATAAGVAPGTVARWLRDPAFARELVFLRPVVEARPVDAAAVMVALDAAEARLAPEGPRVDGDGCFHVMVSIPAGASRRQVEKVTARALARGLAAVERARSEREGEL